MSRAPYLFKEDGTKVLKSSHCVSLEEVDEMQEEYYLGDYLCGRDVAAADMSEFWFCMRCMCVYDCIICDTKANTQISLWYIFHTKI